jgi:hypothetical protein
MMLAVEGVCCALHDSTVATDNQQQPLVGLQEHMHKHTCTDIFAEADKGQVAKACSASCCRHEEKLAAADTLLPPLVKATNHSLTKSRKSLIHHTLKPRTCSSFSSNVIVVGSKSLVGSSRTLASPNF